jgi:hypothetical protein
MQRVHLVYLLYTFVHGDVESMARELRALSVPFRENVDDRAFVSAFVRKMSRYAEDDGYTLSEFLSAALSVLRDYGYRFDPQLTLALKAMMQASAFFEPLAPPDRPFSTAALDVALEMGQEAITEDAVKTVLKREALRLAGEGMQAVPEYLSGILSWRDQLKKGRLTVYVDTSQLDNQVESMRGIAQMLVVAVLVTGAIIGSAIAANVFAASGSHNVRLAIEIGFFGSLALAAVLVITFLRRMSRSDRRR